MNQSYSVYEYDELGKSSWKITPEQEAKNNKILAAALGLSIAELTLGYEQFVNSLIS